MELSFTPAPLNAALLLSASCLTTMGSLVHSILLVAATLLCWNVQMVEWECLCVSVCSCKMNWPALLSTLTVLTVAVLFLLRRSMQRVKMGEALMVLLSVLSQFTHPRTKTVQRDACTIAIVDMLLARLFNLLVILNLNN